jgi:phosphopantothenoylcysteine decarboxylase/phosphopantothenate--cysteine ligase
MGLRIAETCADRGAEVTVIHGNLSEKGGYHGSSVVPVFDSSQLEKALEKYLPDSDIVFHVAAVPDFIPETLEGKIGSESDLNLKLKLNKKIIQKIKKINPAVFLVGFKAAVEVSETELLEKMKKVLETSGADLVVGNDVKKSQTFGSEENEVMVWDGKGVLKIGKCEKREIAQQLVAMVVRG